MPWAYGPWVLRTGDNLAIIGDNKPEWIIAEFGCMAAGGLPTGAYPDSLAEEMEYLISYSDAEFLVVRDQEQVDKILAIWEQDQGQGRKGHRLGLQGHEPLL